MPTNATQTRRNPTRRVVTMLVSLIFLTAGVRLLAQDILLSDFEETNYAWLPGGFWTVTGTCFGSGPAQGTLPNQQTVDGYQGHGLVNTFLNGDGSTGTLTSPSFIIQRKYIRFLIGGGNWRNQTCMNLLVNGQVVRSGVGMGDREHLDWLQWDVSAFTNQTAQLQIVDSATGGWGHINVDQILETDRSLPRILTDATRKLHVEKAYLNLPVKNGAPMRHVTFSVNGKLVRWFDIELANGKPDWWAFMDLTPFKGKDAIIQVDKLPEGSLGLKSIEQSDHIKNYRNLYHEALRPQFHFTTRRGWNNDPNGLVYYDGEYHLFYQHNPYGIKWGNMSWGHAVSPDLVHWKELPVALYPDKHGTMFSGSAVVDWNNTAGFQTGRNKALVCIFAAAGHPFTQGIAYSNDRGRTWTKYADNPVLPHIAGDNRDPKVIWYAPQKKWIMALYLDKNDYGLFSSPNLKQWTRLSTVTIPGTSECPEFFQIPVEGNPADTRWIFYGGNGRYLIGRFDGRTFTPESGPHTMERGNCWYASQTYNDIPPQDGRRILIPWGRIQIPGMPFNQMMGLPVSLTLRTTDEGLRLFASPVRELNSLRTREYRVKAQVLNPGENLLKNIHGELLDILADIAPGDAKEVNFTLRGVPVKYDVERQELTCQDRTAPLKTKDGRIRLRMLVDRTSIDIFGNDGRLYMPMGMIIAQKNSDLAVEAEGGPARINTLEIYEMKSAWKK